MIIIRFTQAAQTEIQNPPNSPNNNNSKNHV